MSGTVRYFKRKPVSLLVEAQRREAEANDARRVERAAAAERARFFDSVHALGEAFQMSGAINYPNFWPEFMMYFGPSEDGARTVCRVI